MTSPPLSDMWLGFTLTGIAELEVGPRRLTADPTKTVVFARGVRYGVEHRGCLGEGCAVTVSVPPGVVDELSSALGVSLAWCGVRDARVMVCEPPTLALLRTLADEIRRGADRLICEELAMTVVARALAGARGGSPLLPVPTPSERRIGRAALGFLTTNFRDALTLDEVARQVVCSKYHLCRTFRRVHGLTIHRFVHRLRINEALRHLLDGAPDLTRLAMDLGYSCHSHFTRVFRREVGRTPTEVRGSGRATLLRL